MNDVIGADKLTPLEQSQLVNQQYREIVKTQKEIIATLMEMNKLKVLPTIKLNGGSE